MKRIFTQFLPGFFLAAITVVAFGISSSQADTNAGTHEIEQLIQSYAQSIDHADTNLAEQVWSNADEVSFIHPRGEEHGLAQIEADVYRDLMGATFSERNLTPKDISVHVYGDAAWSEFQWDFVAKMRKDGSAFHSKGRETQVYRRENGKWRIVHVHYSGEAVTG